MQSKLFLMILILNFVMIYLIQCSIQQTTISAYNEDLQRWNKTNSLISFEQTIQAFPILSQNMEVSKLSKLIQKGGCKYQLQPARFAFVDNQVYLYGQMKDHPRVVIYEKYLKNITQNYRIPDTYFVIHFYDQLIPELIDKNNHKICRQLPLFVYNKNCSSDLEKTKFLLPDPFIVDKWAQSIKQIKQSSRQNKWQNKIQKLFFRGIPSGPHFFDIKPDENVDMFKYYHRGAFVLLSIDHPELIDANFTDYPGPMSDQIQRRVGKDKIIFTKPISLTDHLQYKYLLSADGTGASWKRIPFILYSNSLLFKPYSEKIQWFYDKLIPGVNFVQIKDDLSDLFNKMQEMKENNQQALQIIKNANKLAQQHLNPTTIQKYTIQTLLKYSALQNLTLTQQQKQQIKNGEDIQKILINRDKIPLTIIIATLISFIVLIAIIRFRLRSSFGEKNNQVISIEENSQEILSD